MNELIQQSLDHSTAHQAGNENFVQPVGILEQVDWAPNSNLPPRIIGGPVIDGPVIDGPVIDGRVIDHSGTLDPGTSRQIHDYNPPGRSIATPGSGVISIDDSSVVYDDEELISEEFIETDVREVLTMLTTDANLDLVMDDNVGGIVNARIADLPVDQAIAKILMPLGLVSRRVGDQVIVAPPDPTSPLFSYVSVKREYRPLHLDSSALLETVPEQWLQYVTSVEKAKMILVEAPDRITSDILDRFLKVDLPVPQVVLEAIICVVSPDSGFQFGLDWEHAVELDGAKAMALGATGLALNGEVSKQGLDRIFSDFSSTSAFVKLLNEHGYLTIRASPHVMAKDGEQANIAINRETFFSTQPSGSSGDNAVFFQQDIQKVDAGITLDITPHIRGDLVTVNIEKAEVSEDVRTANNELSINPFPIINRRNVSTTVSVRDGRTIVIGGLVQRETIDQVNRVPGLSRLPGVGYLFQTTQRQTRDAEVVIFLSPRIVDSSASASITMSGG